MANGSSVLGEVYYPLLRITWLWATISVLLSVSWWHRYSSQPDQCFRYHSISCNSRQPFRVVKNDSTCVVSNASVPEWARCRHRPFRSRVRRFSALQRMSWGGGSINRAHAVWVVLISVLPSTIFRSAALDSGHAIYNDGLEIGMPVLAIRLVLFRW